MSSRAVRNAKKGSPLEESMEAEKLEKVGVGAKPAQTRPQEKKERRPGSLAAKIGVVALVIIICLAMLLPSLMY